MRLTELGNFSLFNYVDGKGTVKWQSSPHGRFSTLSTDAAGRYVAISVFLRVVMKSSQIPTRSCEVLVLFDVENSPLPRR